MADCVARSVNSFLPIVVVMPFHVISMVPDTVRPCGALVRIVCTSATFRAVVVTVCTSSMCVAPDVTVCTSERRSATFSATPVGAAGTSMGMALSTLDHGPLPIAVCVRTLK